MTHALLTTLVLLVPLAAAPGAAGQVQNTSSAATSAVPAATGTTGTAPADSEADYRLGAGDKIRVEVYREEQFSQSLQVRPDGKVTIPFAGDVAAAGLTTGELRERIASTLKDFGVKNPVVSVMVVEALASTVYVIGEVNKPGTIVLPGPTTALQVLAMAGGFKDFANTKDILIQRKGEHGLETLHFNYNDAIKGDGRGKGKPPLYLQRGDTIIVQ